MHALSGASVRIFLIASIHFPNNTGVDLLQVQKILGHRSILTTSKYTQLTSNTDNNAIQLINQLINGFSVDWGDVR